MRVRSQSVGSRDDATNDDGVDRQVPPRNETPGGLFSLVGYSLLLGVCLLVSAAHPSTTMVTSYVVVAIPDALLLLAFWRCRGTQGATTRSAWWLLTISCVAALLLHTLWMIIAGIAGKTPDVTSWGWAWLFAIYHGARVMALMVMASPTLQAGIRRFLDLLVVLGAVGCFGYLTFVANWSRPAQVNASTSLHHFGPATVVMSLFALFAAGLTLWISSRRNDAVLASLGSIQVVLAVTIGVGFAIHALNLPDPRLLVASLIGVATHWFATWVARYGVVSSTVVHPVFNIQRTAAHIGVVLTIVLLAVHRSVTGRFDELGSVVLAVMMVATILRSQLTIHDNERLVHELTQRESELSIFAFTDSLTGLDSRRKFIEVLETELDARPQGVCVMYIDLDGFKVVNDEHGHQVGNEVLQQAGERLGLLLVRSPSLARLSGDEFAAIVPQGQNPIVLAEKAVSELAKPMLVSDVRVQVSASVGLATTDEEDNLTAEELLHRADLALYNVKRNGRNGYQLHDAAGVDIELTDRILAPALARAIDAGHIQPFYQPVVSTKTGMVVSYEVLSRWTYQDLEVVPTKFVGVAERAGLVERLTHSVLHAVCQDIVTLDKGAGAPSVRYGINVGGAMLGRDTLAPGLLEIIEEYDLNPAQFYVEVTETLPIGDLRKAAAGLRSLRDAGMGVFLDDFGTGHNSLTQLLRLPLDTVKLDRSIVQTVDGEGPQARAVAGLVDLARHLSLEVVAEGVETSQQARALTALGVNYLQGFFLGRPAEVPTALMHWNPDDEGERTQASTSQRSELPLHQSSGGTSRREAGHQERNTTSTSS